MEPFKPIYLEAATAGADGVKIMHSSVLLLCVAVNQHGYVSLHGPRDTFLTPKETHVLVDALLRALIHVYESESTLSPGRGEGNQ
mgnify:CR=1 FL=1